ncbi:MAG: ketosteroid isomerase-like protein [Hyphomicrobiaceae bacterium]|jgi:ketosteroid isomerase-like protein
MSSSEKLCDLMKRFRAAYAAADAQALATCVTDDFVWHQHVGPDAPAAKTIVGVDAAIQVIRWRQTNWQGLTYTEMNIHYAAELITQSFRVSGQDEHGAFFDVRAVDLYPVRNGRLAAKDTYWKQIRVE